MTTTTVIFRCDADKHRSKHLFPDSVRLVSASAFAPFREWVSETVFIESGAVKVADVIHEAQLRQKTFNNPAIVIADAETIASLIMLRYGEFRFNTSKLTTENIEKIVAGVNTGGILSFPDGFSAQSCMLERDRVEMFIKKDFIEKVSVHRTDVEHFERMGFQRVKTGEDRQRYIRAEALRLATEIFRGVQISKHDTHTCYANPHCDVVEITDTVLREYPNIVELPHGKGLTYWDPIKNSK